CAADARDAVSLLEQVPPSRELGHAYANLGAVHKEAEEKAEAKVWAARAIELGRQLGASDVVIRATTDLGTVEVRDGAPEGLERLEDALTSAGEAGLGDQVGRVYVNLLGAATRTTNTPNTKRPP